MTTAAEAGGGPSPALARLWAGWRSQYISRITTDTTLILSVIGSSVSLALRQAMVAVGGLVMLLLTSAKLTGLLLLLVPVVVAPIFLLGRRLRVLARENQDWIASSSGTALEKFWIQCLPSRLISASTRVESAFTTEIPTPCRPPETA